MKTTKLLLVLLSAMMLSIISNATVRTCSNDFASPGQFTSLQAAITACSTSVMDTILVAGSTVNYGTVSIDRRVCIIGTGFNSQKQNPLKSTLQQIGFANSNASNSQFIGLNFIVSSPSIYCNIANVTGITIKRCKLDYRIDIANTATGCNNWIIEGSIINNLIPASGYGIYINNSIGGWIFRNNIICSIGTGQYAGCINIGSATSNCYILNNVFMGDATAGEYAFQGSNTSFIIFSNNIVWRCAPGTNTSNLVNNNISFGGTPTAFTGIGSNPLAGINPLFVNVGATQSNWSASSDFSLTVSSQGNDAGTDGTDVGVYGGLVGLFLQSGEPDIPIITLFNITSPTSINPGGTLDINVNSKRHQ